MKKMMNKFVLAVAAALLGGCTTFDPMHEIAALPKKGDGVLFVQVGLLDPHNAASVCAAFPGIKDERCDNQDLYEGFMVAASSGYWSLVRIPVLVPKVAGIGSHDILKIRLDGNRPAYFEF